MARAALLSHGGALVMRDLLAPAWFSALHDEARTRRDAAREQRKEQPDEGGWRSGNPARFLATASGGDIQNSVYADPGIAKRLSTAAGRQLRPTGSEGSFSYYDREGHYLGLHRDIRTCDVTLITCLEKSDGAQPSGALRLYPHSARDDLEQITAETPFRDLDMEQGDSVLLLGGVIPHEVLPAAEGFRRTISVLCFEITP